MHPHNAEFRLERAANAPRELGDSENFRRLLEEIGRKLHSGHKLTTEIAESAEIYFCSAASVPSVVTGSLKMRHLIVLDSVADTRMVARL